MKFTKKQQKRSHSFALFLLAVGVFVITTNDRQPIATVKDASGNGERARGRDRIGNFRHFFGSENEGLSYREKQLTHLIGKENEWQPGFTKRRVYFDGASDDSDLRFLNATEGQNELYDGIGRKANADNGNDKYVNEHEESDKTYGVKAIGIFHVFRKPPWGGGNQFLMALVKEFRRRKIKVVENAIQQGVKIYMANAVTFKVDPFREAFLKSGKKLKLVHRLDGPYYSARYNRDPRKEASLPYRAREDDRVYWINNEFACASIFQSKWSFDMNKMLGYSPKGYLQIVNNAVDDTIFHNRGRAPFSRLRKTKIMASSWSAGERKGFKTFKWLDDNLDFMKYEFFFSGNVPDGMTFRNIKVLPPVTSEKLAPMLREHDIFLAASYLEPCSNALVEALASGMPTVYQSGSGHAELVKAGGRSYNKPEEIPRLLDEVVARFEEYQNNIRVTTVSEAADAYLQVYAACLS
jgi:glycosyltransferase involved in cell wall biosynthesis